ncbi:MAG TPA: hypothetical protein VJC05_03435 [Candidatus Andersenbacteria bacterium]|nr:hypothetical protein [Candidatus Andersenbacteria bacterium]
MANLTVTFKSGGDMRPFGQQLGADIQASIKEEMEHPSLREERKHMLLAPEDVLIIERLRATRLIEPDAAVPHLEYAAPAISIIEKPEKDNQGRFELLLTICHFTDYEGSDWYGIHSAHLLYIFPALAEEAYTSAGFLNFETCPPSFSPPIGAIHSTGVEVRTENECTVVMSRSQAYVVVCSLDRGKLFAESLRLAHYIKWANRDFWAKIPRKRAA